MTEAPTTTAAVDEPDDVRDDEVAYLEHVRLTEALRRVIDANAYLEVPNDGIDGLIADVHALAERIEAMAGEAHVPSRTSREVLLADPGRVMSINPIIGHCSPIAPSVDLSLLDGQVAGRTRLGQAYVGPPGRVHGGWVCALLDQVLGFACVAAGSPGFTATITVHLRKATPLDTELELVGRVADVSGRRVSAWGAIYADGELTAEAEGLFIAIPPDYSPEGPPATRSRVEQHHG